MMPRAQLKATGLVFLENAKIALRLRIELWRTAIPRQQAGQNFSDAMLSKRKK
jgi:hypothetical protein